MRPSHPVLAAAVFLGLLLGGTPAVAAPFDGTAEIQLGDVVRAGFPNPPKDTHRYAFFGIEGTVLSAELRVFDGASLDPRIGLIRPGGEPVQLGASLRTSRRGRSTRIDSFVLPFSGWFEIEVTAAHGFGEYRLETRTDRNTRRGRMVPNVESDTSFRFAARSGAQLRVEVKARGRGRGPGARPRITGLTDPAGDSVPISPQQAGSRSIIRHVILLTGGDHTVHFTNDGPRGDVRVIVHQSGPPLPKAFHDLGESFGVAATTVETGDSTLAPRDGYVGSMACGRCHDELFREWSRTAHNSAVRVWDRPGLSGEPLVNDLNGNGRHDFLDRLDLGTLDAFEDFGSDAPVLSYVAGDAFPAKVRIGTVTYDVVRTMGGNGLWRQRYLTKIGASHYVLPIQFNEGDPKGYVPYAPDDWYDDEGEARFTTASQVEKGRSYEALCSGCHGVGATVGVDASTGDFRMGHVEVNIGCEQCHGPGAEHARTGNPEFIHDPRDRLDGTAQGVAHAVELCGRCHVRGESHDTILGSAVHGEYGYNATHGVQQFDDHPELFIDETQDPAQFWGYKANPLAALPGPTFVATRDAQRSREMQAGAHASLTGDAPACFDCHDPHSRRESHQVRSRIDRQGQTTTRLENNTLCLACHAGDATFPGITPADVQAISGGARPAAVVRGVVDHMTDVGMPVIDALYDPTGHDAVGRCNSCHMPATATLGSSRDDAAGFHEGDAHSHTFRIVWPRASRLYGVTNSCNTCHPTREGDSVATIIDDWSQDDADADGTFHADTPASFQNGIANPGRDGGVRCAQCHTTEGFIRIQVRGETLDQAAVDQVVKDSLAGDHGISCRACHGRGADGEFAAGPNPLRFPKAELCARCHNAQTVTFQDFQLRGEMVRHPMKEMIEGTAGAEVPGRNYSDSAHSLPGFFPDNCTTCHYDPVQLGATHQFEAQLDTCGRCHSDTDSFDRPSLGDWDGNGSKDGIQTEIEGLLALLRDALEAQPNIDYVGGYFEFGGATDHKLTGATDPQKRAAYNYYSVDFDESRGVHNAIRAVQLLQHSYEEVTGTPVPGADPR